MYSYIKQYKRVYSEFINLTPNTDKLSKIKGLLNFSSKHHIIFSKRNRDLSHEYIRQVEIINAHSSIRIETIYVYPFDTNFIRCMPLDRRAIASVTMDYSKILTFCLKDFETDINTNSPNYESKEILISTLNAIRKLLKRYIDYLQSHPSARNQQLSCYLQRIESEQCRSFDEALQRILFFNALFWQFNHKQNGIGRLDLILESYYNNDIKKGILTYSSAKELLTHFVKILGKDTLRKSAALIGDTGQVILLGGINKEGKTIENDITHILLEIFTENPMTDPKLILRVNQNTSEQIWEKATECILKGSGSPLIMNENVIIPLMENFGYAKEDIYNFGTSACWEPLIIGKSFDQNNCIKNITILDALTNTLNKYDNNSFNELLQNVKSEITNQIKHHNLNVKFDVSPLFSLFFDNCIEKGKDFTQGGAKYNFHGLLVVGLPNLINSLLNIKEYVYEQHLCTIEDCLDCIYNNYQKREDLRLLFSQSTKRFGSTAADVIELTQTIMDTIDQAVNTLTIFGEKVKVGFSSPGYVALAKNYPASLDGRKQGDSFAVHISPISADIDIAEIIDFASKIKYEGCRLNGNVVDFIIPVAYTKQKDKLTSIIKNACQKGLYEIQLNVLDKATLIDAKQHPEKYPNLIVRVWGFSAYFNDLPEEYKDNLIKRAELYE